MLWDIRRRRPGTAINPSSLGVAQPAPERTQLRFGMEGLQRARTTEDGDRWGWSKAGSLFQKCSYVQEH